MSVIAFLNAAIERNEGVPIPADEAREALRMLECYPLATRALRTLIDHPGDKEAIKHAQRCIAVLEESEARAAAKKAAAAGKPAGPDHPPHTTGAAAASSDISDLG